jgi:heme oxygenase
MLTSTPFSGHLRSATTPDHTTAEASAFMTAVMNGAILPRQYAALVVQLQAVYSALDAAAAVHRDKHTYGPFFDPRLDRGAAIAQDLDVLDGTGLSVTAATRAYTRRLNYVACDPLLVLAHHYTRYLGDLSGGRAIAARLQQALGLTPTNGLALYQFHVGPAPSYKSAYRQRLDDLDLSTGDQNRFIDEVQTAYRLNVDVLSSLDPLL